MDENRHVILPLILGGLSVLAAGVWLTLPRDQAARAQRGVVDTAAFAVAIPTPALPSAPSESPRISPDPTSVPPQPGPDATDISTEQASQGSISDLLKKPAPKPVLPQRGANSVPVEARQAPPSTAPALPPETSTSTSAKLPIPAELPPMAAPPQGKARVRIGSIPVERRLVIDGNEVRSFSLARESFVPGRHQALVSAGSNCISFSFMLEPDSLNYLIWDFEGKAWKAAKVITQSGVAPLRVNVEPCKE